MPEPVTEPRPQGGRIAENILYFARTLRAAGLPVGPGRALEALNAVEAVGLGRGDDLYWTLHGVFVNRCDQLEVFDQAFHVFWRNPEILQRLLRSAERSGGNKYVKKVGFRAPAYPKKKKQ